MSERVIVENIQGDGADRGKFLQRGDENWSGKPVPRTHETLGHRLGSVWILRGNIVHLFYLYMHSMDNSLEASKNSGKVLIRFSSSRDGRTQEAGPYVVRSRGLAGPNPFGLQINRDQRLSQNGPLDFGDATNEKVPA